MVCLCSTAISAKPLVQKADFDYATYATLLKSFVNNNGLINYRQLKVKRHLLGKFIRSMNQLKPSVYKNFSDKAKIAFWLNAYNSLTLKAIIDHYPIKSSWTKSLIYPKNSIRQIPGVWDKLKFYVMGKPMSLSDIEHKVLRKKFHEPRIHMAMVCAAIGCPPLRNEPYIAEKLDSQLDDQAKKFLSNPSKFRIDRQRSRVYISPIFKWFAEDFVLKYGTGRHFKGHDAPQRAVLNFISKYVNKRNRNYLLNARYTLKYLKYDWSLNEQVKK